MLFCFFFPSELFSLSEIIRYFIFCLTALKHTVRAGALFVLSAQFLTQERCSVNTIE